METGTQRRQGSAARTSSAAAGVPAAAPAEDPTGAAVPVARAVPAVLLTIGVGLLCLAAWVFAGSASATPGAALPLDTDAVAPVARLLPPPDTGARTSAAPTPVVHQPGTGPYVGATPAAVDSSAVDHGEVVAPPAAVEIPRIGVDADLIDLGLDERRRLEVPEDAAVPGWYERGPRPGEPGPAVITGHVDSVVGPGIFFRLAELEPGDEVTVRRHDGTSVTFVVDRVERWSKDEFPTDAVYRHADGPELRVITCGGEFDRAERSYRDNIIVFAHAAA